MSYLNRIAALVLGVLMYPASVYVLRSTLLQIDYFQFPSKGLFADTVINGARNTLPFFVLSLTLSWIALRWLARQPRIAVGWCFAGLIVGFMCWEVVFEVQDYYGCLDRHLDYKRQYYAPHPGVFMSLRPEALPACNLYDNLRWRWWWTVPPFLAVLAGFAAAASIALRSERITARPVPA